MKVKADQSDQLMKDFGPTKAVKADEPPRHLVYLGGSFMSPASASPLAGEGVADPPVLDRVHDPTQDQDHAQVPGHQRGTIEA